MHHKLLIFFFYTICFSPVSIANRTPETRFKAELNSTKTHYFVSLKAIDGTHPGYTAVYDAATHKMKFKINVELCSGMTYLSPNGEKLVSVKGDFYNQSYPSLDLAIYDSSGLKSSTVLAPYNFRQADLLDIEVNDTSVLYIFNDSIWSVSTATWEMTKKVNDYGHSSFDNSFFYKQTPTGSSLFSLPELTFKGLTLKEHLLNDLNLPEATMNCAKKYISISIVIDSTGKVIQLKVLSFPFIKNKKGEYTQFFKESNSETQQKIIALIGTYDLSKTNLHDNAAFWIYEGGFYI